MAEQMTSLERMRKAVRYEEGDRVPVFPLAHYATTRANGAKIKDFATNGNAMAESLLAALELYGWDGVTPGTDVVIEAEALGSETVQPEDAPAFVVRPRIQVPEDLDALSVPDPHEAGRMPVVIKATEICARAVGDRVYIQSWIMGPMNISSQLRGVEQLMYDTVERPDFFERLLDFATEVAIAYGKALVDAGAHMIGAGEALCSPAFISPATYRKYVVPRQKRLFKELADYGAEATLLHICANIDSILEDAVSTGATALDLDWQMDMRRAKQVCWGKSAMRGNLDPSRVLLEGTPELVFEKCLEVLQAKKGGGLILGSGCDVSPDTSKENLMAMVEAAKTHGRF